MDVIESTWRQSQNINLEIKKTVFRFKTVLNHITFKTLLNHKRYLICTKLIYRSVGDRHFELSITAVYLNSSLFSFIASLSDHHRGQCQLPLYLVCNSTNKLKNTQSIALFPRSSPQYLPSSRLRTTYRPLRRKFCHASLPSLLARAMTS